MILGALLVYDVTDQDSFERVNFWLNQLKKFAPENIVIQVVGNKIDLQNERKLSKAEVSQFCKNNNILYIETSAKEDIGIAQSFRNIGSGNYFYYKAILKKKKGNRDNDNNKRKKVLDLSSRKSKTSSKRKCC